VSPLGSASGGCPSTSPSPTKVAQTSAQALSPQRGAVLGLIRSQHLVRDLTAHNGRVSIDQTALRRYTSEDRDQVLSLDTSVLSDSIYRISPDGDSFLISLEPLDPPRVKTFDLDDDLTDGAWDQASVVQGPAGVVAFCATRFERWQRRQVVMGLYVDAGWRRRGLGRRLLDDVCSRGNANNASHVWLETANVNVSAVRAYMRMGFVLCGLDVSFYRGTSDASEVGLFMSKDIPDL
jgi:GNAT superfamily N-acetyltransferase